MSEPLQRRQFLRRSLLFSLTGLGLVAACGAPSSQTTTSAPTSPAAPAPTTGAAPTQANPFGAQPTTAPATTSGGGNKMTYWGGLIFSDAANNLFSKAVQDWGNQNNLQIDVVMINQQETNQKVAAAVESNTMPDALDMGLDLLLLLSPQNKLVPLDDLYNKIGQAHGGWLKPTESAMDPKTLGGTRAGIPFGVSGNLLHQRKDVLAAAGLTPPPKTWQDVSDWSAKAQKPPQTYGMGLTLASNGDGNTQVGVLQSFGGRIADEAGKKCTVKSDATRNYLEWISGAFKQGLFPPGVTTWDGAGDNNSYQSGQAIFIANTGSVYIWTQQNDQDLMNNTVLAALPTGPTTRVSPATPQVRGIPVGGKHVDEAKALLEYLSNKDFVNAYFKVAIYGPVLQEQASYDAFNDPLHQGLLDLAQNGSGPAGADVNNTAFADFNNNYIVPKMIQRMVVDNWDADRAMDEAQQAGDAVYGKYA
ncbi:MAG: extracellular solute-binding protein [Chloroflexi bacterium]|nr:extracellular solute-binding protein [Chloroflexota bacterium]